MTARHVAPRYQLLAQQVDSYNRAQGMSDIDDSDHWIAHHGNRLNEIMEGAPTGSGFDDSISLEIDGNSQHGSSTPERLVFLASFRPMAESMYVGWTYYLVIVTSSLAYGLTIEVTQYDADDPDDPDDPDADYATDAAYTNENIRQRFEGWLAVRVDLENNEQPT